MRRVLRWVLALYLLLLMVSHVMRWLPVSPSAPPHDVELVTVAARAGTRALDDQISLAYRRWLPEDTSEGASTILLLHGSPGSSRDFRTLGPALGKSFRVLAPDLPGFGASEHRVPDYSIHSHASYALDLLDRVGVESIHLLGFSMGGGVALEMVAQAPHRVRSLTLLSATGVQELELLGDYHLNRAIHGLQLGFLWILREGLPHFGALDNAPFGIPYARNFYDTDQRPLRAILERIEVPVLILHGKQDFLVPVAAAHEHHRLAPQGELLLFDTGHFMVFVDGDSLATPIADFLARVDRGEAEARADASSSRRKAASEPFDANIAPPASGVTLFVLAALIAAATLLTEDVACLGTGLLVAQGRIGFLAGTLACFVGIVVGDVLLYWAGRSLGRPWLHRAPLKWLVSPSRVERSARWFERRGPAVVFISRFLPGTRVATYFSAGLLRADFGRFLLYFALAVALWTPLLVGGATLLGARVFDYFGTFERWALPLLALLLVAIWLLAKLLPLITSWRGRRRLLGWWCHWRHWEFWPPWLFYPPVVLWIARLAIKYRCLTLFTATNPAMPAGGFIGESKADILEGLASTWVAPFRRIPGSSGYEAKLALVRGFLETQDLSLPFVLKPDCGQRGTGVKIARSWADVERYCAVANMDFLVQQYVPGREYGVFYARLPEQATGRIISITEKHLPSVRGDGLATLEELVLADSRAVCLASVYLRRFGSRCNEVPQDGEEVPLADLGTHCRGALFLDGGHLLTSALEKAIDDISQGYEGFFFGRYDIRTPSADSFRAAKDLSIVELNGVTSEATHIYDRRNSLFDAYRTLFHQWQLAFEVGRQNRARGTAPVTALALVRQLITYRRSMRAAQLEDFASQ